jgi:hypothetical protein
MKIVSDPTNLIADFEFICQNSIHKIGWTSRGEIFCSHENIENEYMGTVLNCYKNRDTSWEDASFCVRYIRLLEMLAKHNPEAIPEALKLWKSINNPPGTVNKFLINLNCDD